ncbi:MAG: hypothetical protein QOC65_212 [Sphingomonadales bacterium]|nr:hypothetical protein [Sphingomonadales bacterium]
MIAERRNQVFTEAPFFATVPGNAYTIRKSIERVERQISDVDRKIAAIHGEKRGADLVS